MTSPTTHNSPRVLAPSPRNDPSRPSLPLPKRTKRSNACIACKARKSKCGGGQPCNKCIEIGSKCIFDVGLDRRRKYAQRHAEQELTSLRQLLEKIVNAFDAGDLAQLGELLSNVRGSRSSQAESHERSLPSDGKIEIGKDFEDETTSIQSVSGENTRRASASSDSSASVGSLDEVDALTEDPNRNLESRAAGYIGKESEIAWMQKLNAEASKLDSESEQQSPPIEEPIASISYHLDYLQIDDSLPVEPRLLPPKPWAARLMNIFFESIAPSFPLLNRPLFASQFNYAFTSSTEPTGKWLTVLNLVFAVSSKYYQLADPVTGKDVNDHIFLSRAISLSTSHDLTTKHADLHQVQIELLLAIYFMVSGQINRSWQANGRAARSATSLGLNLRALSDQIDPVSKEIRTRIWWCIFYLEHLLAGMTGRSSCVDYRSISLYPPVPYDESLFQLPDLKDLLGNISLREKRLQWTLYAGDSELQARKKWFQMISPTHSLYFFHLVDLSVITHAAVTTIYSPTASNDGGLQKIPHYQEKLQTWLSNLQPPFAFTDAHNSPTVSRDRRGQVGLALAYYSSQIILSRPCLTSPVVEEGRSIYFPRSRLGNDTAKTCVHSSLALISVLPDQPSTDWVLKMTPWWSILHFIMQALTILLIQLSVGPIPFLTSQGEQAGQGGNDPNIAANENQMSEIILSASKKALRWLHTLAKNDPSSRRAFQISDSFIRRIGRAKGLDLTGIPSVAELAGKAPSAFSLGDPHPWVDSPLLGGSSSHRRSSSRAVSASRSGSRTMRMQDTVNWGPDCTVSETEYERERQQRPFALDPALFSVDM
ncbi:fungal-specific transcription factor domain-containing protein [Aspergillus recurvatus]